MTSSDDLVTIVAAVIGSGVISAVVTGVVSYKVNKSNLEVQQSTLDQQRLTANTTLMSDLMALAHGRDPHGVRPNVGQAEILGAIETLTAIGLDYAPLQSAAKTFLKSLISMYSVLNLGRPPQPAEEQIASAAATALARF